MDTSLRAVLVILDILLKPAVLIDGENIPPSSVIVERVPIYVEWGFPRC